MRFSCTFPELNNGYTFPAMKVERTSTAFEYLSMAYRQSGSASEWSTRLANGQVKLKNGQPVAADTVLRPGDCICYTRAPWHEPDAPNYLDVLYEDEHLVLPRGLFNQRTLLWLLQQYHQQHRSSKYPLSSPPAPVHRLGRGTSGVLLCACTEAARKQLCKDFERATAVGAEAAALTAPSTVQGAGADAAAGQRPLGKQYRALVQGTLEQDEGEVRVPIGQVQYGGLGTGLFAASPTGKPALSLYRVLTRHEDSTLVEVTILTGRPHQIRVHMAALGHPLVGDPLYGPGGVPKAHLLRDNSWTAELDEEGARPGDCGYYLHSMQLEFRHPATGAAMTLAAPVPPQLQTPAELEAASS